MCLGWGNGKKKREKIKIWKKKKNLVCLLGEKKENGGEKKKGRGEKLRVWGWTPAAPPLSPWKGSESSSFFSHKKKTTGFVGKEKYKNILESLWNFQTVWVIPTPFFLNHILNLKKTKPELIFSRQQFFYLWFAIDVSEKMVKRHRWCRWWFPCGCCAVRRVASPTGRWAVRPVQSQSSNASSRIRFGVGVHRRPVAELPPATTANQIGSAWPATNSPCWAQSAVVHRRHPNGNTKATSSSRRAKRERRELGYSWWFQSWGKLNPNWRWYNDGDRHTTTPQTCLSLITRYFETWVTRVVCVWK